MLRPILAVGSCWLALAFALPVVGQIIVDENFDGYTDDFDLMNTWGSDFGDGRSPQPGVMRGILVPRVVPPFPPAPFDGTGDPGAVPPIEPVVGQAVTFSDADGGIMEWDNDGDPNSVPFELVPTPTHAVQLSADIFDSAELLNDGGTFNNATRRFSVALRNDTVDRDPGIGTLWGWNFVELGFWNASATDPTDPTDPPANVPATGYAYRATLFGSRGGDLLREPNWLYFELPAEFDDPNFDHNGDGRVGNGDGVVNYLDVGPGWHRFSATVTETEVTYALDLFRNGVVDASQTWVLGMVPDAPFTSLRMGGPSGVSMNEFSMVDNIRLELVEVSTGGGGDFDGDGVYSCADVNSLVVVIAAGTNDSGFDLTGDGQVSRDDLDAWLAEAGAAQLPSGNPYPMGDANLDGNVDVSDFNAWNGAKFTSTPAWCSGDFNADGTVDVSDFNLWNGNKFTSAANLSAVPEPAGGMLLWLSTAFLLRAVRRRR